MSSIHSSEQIFLIELNPENYANIQVSLCNFVNNATISESNLRKTILHEFVAPTTLNAMDGVIFAINDLAGRHLLGEGFKAIEYEECLVSRLSADKK